MYGYVYLTTNLINGRQYIGQKKSKEFLGNTYLGSGKYLKNAILKYGREAFIVELLEECNSYDELNQAEIDWIEWYNAVESENFYNLSKGGKAPSYKASDSTKQKMRDSHLGKRVGEVNSSKRPEVRVKMSKSHMGKALSMAHRKHISDSKRGKSFTDEHKRNLKISREGYHHSQETIAKIRQSNKGQIPWNKGKAMSEEQKRKISESRKAGIAKRKSLSAISV